MNFEAGAINVITVMTQSRADMTAPNNYTFKGTKLVPTETQRGMRGLLEIAHLKQRVSDSTPGCCKELQGLREWR